VGKLIESLRLGSYIVCLSQKHQDIATGTFIFYPDWSRLVVFLAAFPSQKRNSFRIPKHQHPQRTWSGQKVDFRIRRTLHWIGQVAFHFISARKASSANGANWPNFFTLTLKESSSEPQNSADKGGSIIWTPRSPKANGLSGKTTFSSGTSTKNKNVGLRSQSSFRTRETSIPSRTDSSLWLQRNKNFTNKNLNNLNWLSLCSKDTQAILVKWEQRTKSTKIFKCSVLWKAMPKRNHPQFSRVICKKTRRTYPSSLCTWNLSPRNWCILSHGSPRIRTKRASFLSENLKSIELTTISTLEATSSLGTIWVEPTSPAWKTFQEYTFQMDQTTQFSQSLRAKSTFQNATAILTMKIRIKNIKLTSLNTTSTSIWWVSTSETMMTCLLGTTTSNFCPKSWMSSRILWFYKEKELMPITTCRHHVRWIFKRRIRSTMRRNELGQKFSWPKIHLTCWNHSSIRRSQPPK